MRPAPKSENRAHTGSMEMRAIWSYIDLTWLSNSVTWSVRASRHGITQSQRCLYAELGIHPMRTDASCSIVPTGSLYRGSNNDWRDHA
jgi:hypothetical protein